MRHTPAHALILAALAAALPAAAEDFDPTSYLQQHAVDPPSPVAATAVGESEVKVRGIRYRVLRTGAGSLYLPRADQVRKEDLESGLCANELSYELEKCQPGDDACVQRNHDHMVEEVTVVRAEAPISGSLVAYAELVGETIRRKCGGINATYFTATKLRPEVGLRWQGGTEREPKTYEIFNNLTKGLGFRSRF